MQKVTTCKNCVFRKSCEGMPKYFCLIMYYLTILGVVGFVSYLFFFSTIR
jgi:hypothetical protein